MKNNFFLPVNNAGSFLTNLKVKEYIDSHQDQVRIKSGGTVSAFYGAFPTAIWNGGRTYPGFLQPMSKKSMENIVDTLNSRGISARMTFTNLLLTEEHLKDEYCNMILDIIDNGYPNEVIVASNIMKNYINDTHPNIPLISSITKGNDLKTFKTAFEDDYRMIVAYAKRGIIDYLKENSTLEERDRVEILLESGCGHCKKTYIHYGIESYNNLNPHNHRPDFVCFREREGYTYPNEIPYEERIVDDFNELTTLGFHNYKITGRGMWISLDYNLNGYADQMLLPKYKDEFKKEILSWCDYNFNIYQQHKY